MKKLAKETNLTIILSSYILSELEHLATRLVIMHHGQKIEAFTKDELKIKLQSYYELGVTNSSKAINILKEAYEDIEFELGTDGIIKTFYPSIPATDISDLTFQHQISLYQLVLKSHDLEEMFVQLTEGAHPSPLTSMFIVI